MVPADGAGIEAGDLMVQINDTPTRQIMPEEAANAENLEHL